MRYYEISRREFNSSKIEEITNLMEIRRSLAAKSEMSRNEEMVYKDITNWLINTITSVQYDLCTDNYCEFATIVDSLGREHVWIIEYGYKYGGGILPSGYDKENNKFYINIEE